MTQLFSTIEGIDVHLNRSTGGPDPDLRFPLMCLPGLCGTRFDSVPDKVPYIGPPKGRTFDLPGAVPDRLKIGVIWESSDAARHRRLSNVPLRELLPLAARRDVTLYSLQKGPAAVDLMRFLASGLIHDLSNEIDDYLDMARAMSALDLVIAVDSVSTQLAAAMGLEIWVMADYACDWRWRRSGEKTPWYPTARIFRQSEPGDWAGVIAEVSQALTAGRSPAG